jgi:hypothetical protein
MLSMLEDSTSDAKRFNDAKAEGLIKGAEGLLDEAMQTEQAGE